MILEMVGSRVVAPYLGTSIVVWTSLIGVILAAMSAGYWCGGALSDRRPEPRTLSFVVFLAACATAAAGIFATPALLAIQLVTQDLRIGSVVSSAVLFGLPTFFLGMVLPYSVRLRTHGLADTGRTAGALCALSTVGSIAGTFLGGFVLVAHFGTVRIIAFVALLLLVVSLVAWRERPRLKAAAVGLLVLVGLAADAAASAWMGPTFHDISTPYSRVWVYDKSRPSDGRPIRSMQISDEMSSAMFLDGDDLVLNYSRFYRLAAHFKPGLKEALMIGGGALCYPRDYLRSFPDARMDVVEIDPKLTAVARELFGFRDDPRLRVVHEDGRTFLNRNRREYDVIFLDAYRSIYSVPYQLTTVEAVRKMHKGLKPDGVLIANFISAIEGDNGLFLRAEAATMKSVFSQVYLFPVDDPENAEKAQNVVLVALKSPDRPRFYSEDRELNACLRHLWIKEVKADVPVLTDDFAPVDAYIARILARGVKTPNPLRDKFKAWVKKERLGR